MKKEQFTNIITDISRIKNEVRDVNIKFGLEVDYIEGKESEINDYIEKFPLDYVIGSVHYVNDWNFDTNRGEFKNIDIDQFYKDYFVLIQKAARSGLFDIIGHIDIAKKFNYFPSFDLKPYYEKTARILSKSDVVIELNTSGLDKPCKEFYPGNTFLQICYLQNVPVTLGSDAHFASDIARYFPETILKLKSIGYRKIATFKNRNRSFINL